MKIDFDDKAFAAKLLLLRMKEKQEKEEKMRNSIQEEEKEAEKDCLFYWILSRMYAQMDSCIPAKRAASIRITGSLTRYNKVLLEHGKSDNYLPFYVAGKDFFDVVKDTIEIFDNMDHFNAVYFQTSDEACEINVFMSI